MIPKQKMCVYIYIHIHSLSLKVWAQHFLERETSLGVSAANSGSNGRTRRTNSRSGKSPKIKFREDTMVMVTEECEKA